MYIQKNDYQRIFNYLINIGLILSISLLIYSILFSIKFLLLEGPQEYRENAIILTTDLLLKGKNPYSLENLPVYLNVYGIFYHFIVYPFSKIFGSSFFIHRLVSLFFLILSCSAIYWVLRKKNVSIQLSLIAFTLLFIQLFNNIGGILARPDTLGLFLFLCSIIIPWRYNFTYTSLIGGIILSILGFLTKPYFLFGAPCIALYLFITKSKLKGIIYSLLFGTCLVLTFLIISHFYEYYFFSAVLNHFSEDFSIRHLIQQTIRYGEFVFFLVVILPVVCLLALFRHMENIKDEAGGHFLKYKLFNIRNLSEPFIYFNFGMMSFMLICSLLAMLKFGQSHGSGVTYYYQLISPFLIIVIFKNIGNTTKFIEYKTFIVYLIVVQLFVFNFNFARVKFPLPVNHIEQWQEWKDLLSRHKNVLNSPPLAYILNEQNKTVYDTGQSQYFSWGLLDSRLAKLSGQSQVINKARKHYIQYLETIKKQAQDKSFDLIAITKNSSPFLPLDIIKENYIYQETKHVKMYFGTFPVDIWAPKK